MSVKARAGVNGEKRFDVNEAGQPGPVPVAPPVMKLEVVVFHVRGLSPLLQNNPAAFIGKTGGDELAGKKVYDDAEEARLRVYTDEDQFVHPTEAFLKAAKKAVGGKKFGKVSARAVLNAAVFVADQWSVLEGPDGKPLTRYAIDRRSVVVQKARVLRCRPSWMPWCARVALELDTAVIGPANVADALNLGGRNVGVGDNRPEKGGPNGRYVVTLK